MSSFFDEPRLAAGFHVLIFLMWVFNKPHKSFRQGVPNRKGLSAKSRALKIESSFF